MKEKMVASQDFKFRPVKDALFIEVYYEGEESYRYLINVVKQSCTCTGFSIREKCKHITRLQEMMKMIGTKVLKPFHFK